MNHFLINGGGGRRDLRYGAYAIEVLLNALLRSGAEKRNIIAKAFGGARMFEYGVNIGAENVRFTTAALKDEGTTLVSSDFGGRQARRVLFHPVSGTARVCLVPNQTLPNVAALPMPHRPGTVTFFERS